MRFREIPGIVRRAAVAAALCLAAACVHETVPRESGLNPSRMIITRDLQGVRISLLTEKNVFYRLYYREGSGAWVLLPQGQQIRGTGERVEIIDPHPNAPQRRYRSETMIPDLRR
jgi:hypothetical protein